VPCKFSKTLKDYSASISSSRSAQIIFNVNVKKGEDDQAVGQQLTGTFESNITPLNNLGARFLCLYLD
jgi:hypothetical protein